MFLKCYLDKNVKSKGIHEIHFTKRSECLHQTVASGYFWEGEWLGEGAVGEGRLPFSSMFYICWLSNLEIQMQN